MKSINLFTPTILIFFLIILSLPSKAGDKCCVKLKKYIESKEEFKKFKKDSGFPIWDKSIEHTFNNDKLTIVPFVDYENSYVNGLLFLIENETSMKYRFLSRNELVKQYVGKKKSKKLSYHHSLIATFLKFDLTMYNFVEIAFSQDIDLIKGKERSEIKKSIIGEELPKFVYDK